MRIMVVETLSEPGGPGVNEDAVGSIGDSARGAAWTLDGATGLAGRSFVTGAASDAAWCAGRLGAGLAAASLAPEPPSALIRRVLEGLAADYARAVGGAEVPAHGLPSASGVWARWEAGGRLEFAALGDCKALFQPDGEPARLLGGAAAAGWSDARVNRAVEQLQAEGVEDAATRFERLIEPLRRFRATMNRPGGYWIFGTAPEAADHLVTETRGVTGPATLLLVSDGFYRLVDTYGTFDDGGLVAAARARGLVDLYRELREIEGADADCRRHPRLKPRDDASAALIRWDNR